MERLEKFLSKLKKENRIKDYWFESNDDPFDVWVDFNEGLIDPDTDLSCLHLLPSHYEEEDMGMLEQNMIDDIKFTIDRLIKETE